MMTHNLLLFYSLLLQFTYANRNGSQVFSLNYNFSQIFKLQELAGNYLLYYQQNNTLKNKNIVMTLQVKCLIHYFNNLILCWIIDDN